jgi:hypothetical protein
MALLLPNLRQVLKFGYGIKDAASRKAVQALEEWADELVRRLSRLEEATGGDVTLPIAQSDVTNLVTDLAAKVPTTRTISTTAPLSGGGDLSANRTIVVADNSITSKGVVATAPNDTTKFWRGDASWAVPPASSSGYQGSWAAGTYAAGAIVRRGPFLFGPLRRVHYG